MVWTAYEVSSVTTELKSTEIDDDFSNRNEVEKQFRTMSEDTSNPPAFRKSRILQVECQSCVTFCGKKQRFGRRS